MMAFGNKDTIIAHEIKQSDREFELGNAPVKRLLQKGSQKVHDSKYSTGKFRMSEGALLTFKQAVEDYALALADEVGKSTLACARVTIQAGDVENAMSKIPVPEPTLPEQPKPEEKTEEKPKFEWKAGFFEGMTVGDAINICDGFKVKVVKVLSNAYIEEERGMISDETITAVNRMQTRGQDIRDMLQAHTNKHMHVYIVEINKYLDKIQELLDGNGVANTECGCGD